MSKSEYRNLHFLSFLFFSTYKLAVFTAKETHIQHLLYLSDKFEISLKNSSLEKTIKLT